MPRWHTTRPTRGHIVDLLPNTGSGHRVPPEASNNIYEMREALGAHVHEYLIRNKREEWDAFKA